MLDLYTWPTPNGKKVPILLAELDWAYELHLVNLGRNEQNRREYLAINPNGKIPALVDTEGTGGGLVMVFESGAILQYLAEKSGLFLPTQQPARAEALSWVFWQVGGPGPFFGQFLSFSRQVPRNDEAIEKFRAESKRLVRVLDHHLGGREWVAGAYSIADMMNYPWFAALLEHAPDTLDGADAVQEWMGRMAERPAVKKGMAI